jgi:hypothetical protein
VTGVLHAFAPPLALEIVPGDPYATVMGRGAYGHAYEGVPGCLHGGHVSIAFDEVLLLASAMDGVLRMTGQLNVTYRLPVPICTDIRYEARLDRIEGRKAFVTGTLHAGDVLCAEATGLFIAPREGRIEELHLEREAR